MPTRLTPRAAAHVAENLLELVGQTPLLHLSRFRPEDCGEMD
jgi:hypothetical protein